ncbi:FKBP-type peptidyl-prolyl cis-trans isomerase N-terminal domain-containing protein [Enterobacter asburiae]|uniref:FKBP-type peptidyl-prolyl cis-trans isomerase N-terminal domain-containing protein n=1 Tax=Scandinavium sp. UTDF21-P1B TaxID=3446379 RepID=UPI003494F4CE
MVNFFTLRGAWSLWLLLIIPCSLSAQEFIWDHSRTSEPLQNNFLAPPVPATPPMLSQPMETKQPPIDAGRLKQQERQINRLKQELTAEKKLARQQQAGLKAEIQSLKKQAAAAPKSLPTANLGPVLDAIFTLTDIRASFARLTSSTLSARFSLSAEQKADYATGILIGRDIALMQQRNRTLSMPNDSRAILAGIEDQLKQKNRLTEDELDAVLQSRESSLQTASQRFASQQRLQDARYIKQFIQRSGSRRAASGFYYRIEQHGRGKIRNESQVDIQVTESLADGTVVNDMARTGSFISQQLQEYPPLFKDALSLIGNQGQITLLVPPELAYGDKGYPPSIPPGATLIYSIKVQSVTL